MSIQQKTYRIGEAGKLLNLKTYVLRFWETEFAQLQPLRTETGQRLYSAQDVALLKTIRHLLHERGMTIEGARKALAEQPAMIHQFTVDADSGLTPKTSASSQQEHQNAPSSPVVPDQHLLPVQGMSLPVQAMQQYGSMECPPLPSMHDPVSSGEHNSSPEGQGINTELMQDVISELENLRDILKSK